MRDEPDIEILQALGRVVWWAISLEDVEGPLASAAGVWEMKSPAGTLVVRAVEAMRAMEPAPVIDAAILWAKDVERLLKRRNNIMHGTPMINTARPADLGSLQYLPRDRSGVVDTPLTAQALDSLGDELRSTYARWRDVTIDLSAIVHERRDGP